MNTVIIILQILAHVGAAVGIGFFGYWMCVEGDNVKKQQIEDHYKDAA